MGALIQVSQVLAQARREMERDIARRAAARNPIAQSALLRCMINKAAEWGLFEGRSPFRSVKLFSVSNARRCGGQGLKAARGTPSGTHSGATSA